MEKFKNSDNLYGILPVPVWYQILTSEELGEDLTKFNDKLKDIANEYYQKWQIEVPDERHLCKSMTKDYISSFVQRKTFTQQYNPAIGKWHAVPTNNFLSIDELEVKKLKGIIVNSYTQALDTFYNSQKMFELDYNFKEAKKENLPA